jgi:hypothetical protein
MKLRVIIPVFAVTMAVVWIALGQARPKADDVHEFMRAKLEHSKKILEGLATEDLPSVAQHSSEISLLSRAASWQVVQTPEYLHRSQQFRQIADRLTEAAKKKNLDGATLAYVELTMNCIDCHKYVRGVRLVKFELPKSRSAPNSASPK